MKNLALTEAFAAKKIDAAKVAEMAPDATVDVEFSESGPLGLKLANSVFIQISKTVLRIS
jgi:hypothetical protein